LELVRISFSPPNPPLKPHRLYSIIGGIKPNVSTFGADQFDDNDEADQKQKASYFNWFYWSINLGITTNISIHLASCQQ
jgi:dipeptide/tripeptide permease